VILPALALLGFGVADLVRWSPVENRRRLAAIAAGTATVVAFAWLGGFSAAFVVGAGVLSSLLLGLWIEADRVVAGGVTGTTEPNPRAVKPPLAMAVLLLGLIAAAGAADPIGGSLASWYSNLPFAFAESVELGQFVLALGTGLFLLASANRIVRYVLQAAGTPAEIGERSLRGGRLLGPMERLIVAATILAGDSVGVALVIAAKGLLRFPEIRGGADELTEYLLIGTFTSLLLAGALAAFVLAAG
jgi:hypothetical protein